MDLLRRREEEEIRQRNLAGALQQADKKMHFAQRTMGALAVATAASVRQQEALERRNAALRTLIGEADDLARKLDTATKRVQG
mmetsp:Transcript_12586/g.29400  ORF Transcript_12586/g.29400 Transcript_12586/m.29400 type:complete len:83 (+) Transcript_12586:119-367(+)